jgi:hypothetical protein
LDTGLELSGIVSAWQSTDAQTPAWVQLSGTPRLAKSGALIEAASCPNEYLLPLGALSDGRSLGSLSRDDLTRRTHAGILQLELGSGVKLSGSLREAHASAGRVEWALLDDFELLLPSGQMFCSRAPYPLALGALVSVSAGAPAAYFGGSEPSLSRVPRPRWFDTRERNLLGLYEQAVEGWKSLAGAELVARFELVRCALDRDYPDDWLLRWNLLESLVKVGQEGALSAQLTRDLEHLEIKYLHLEPIATGLAHIRALVR